MKISTMTIVYTLLGVLLTVVILIGGVPEYSNLIVWHSILLAAIIFISIGVGILGAVMYSLEYLVGSTYERFKLTSDYPLQEFILIFTFGGGLAEIIYSLNLYFQTSQTVDYIVWSCGLIWITSGFLNTISWYSFLLKVNAKVEKSREVA